MRTEFKDTPEIIELISLTKQGDSDAFSRLVDIYTPLLNRISGELCCALVTLEELFTEACVVLHKAVLSYIGTKNVTFGLYARICLSRRLSDMVERVLRAPMSVELDENEISNEVSAEARLIGAERHKQNMEIARTLLSDYEYRVFRLYIDGYNTADIAEILGKTSKSVDNAKSRMFRTLKENSKLFSDN